VQLAMKQMATVAYWCIPDAEIRLTRFGTTGAVRQSVERYARLRKHAPSAT